jgi:uracil-DNA glycosylase
LDKLKSIQLTLVIGQYAQAYHLPEHRGTLTELVANWSEYWPRVVPLPHPSPRNNIWLRRNLWFEKELVPKLQTQVAKILAKVN